MSRQTLNVTQKAVESQDASFKQTLCEMKAQSQAMQKAAQAAEDTVKLGLKAQRSRLAFSWWNLSKFGAGQRPEVNYRVVNTGHSPANIIKQHTGYTVGLALPETPNYSTVLNLNRTQIHRESRQEETVQLRDFDEAMYELLPKVRRAFGFTPDILIVTILANMIHVASSCMSVMNL